MCGLLAGEIIGEKTLWHKVLSIFSLPAVRVAGAKKPKVRG